MTLARLWAWSVNLLAIVGAATVVSLAVFWLNFLLAPEDIRRRSLPAVSPTAKALAAKIAPSLQQAARDYEPEFLAEAENPWARWAAGHIYPVFVERIPRGTEVVADRFLTDFGGMTIQDIVSSVVEHARQKAEPVDDSLRDYNATHNRMRLFP